MISASRNTVSANLDTSSSLNISITDQIIDTANKQHLRVLVVEDDMGDFILLKHCLTRLDTYHINVTHAPSLVVASDLMRTEDFDLAFVDYWLGKDTVINLLKEHSGRNASLPLILITGMLNKHVQDTAQDAGATGCLHKGDLSSRLVETTIRYVLHTHQLEMELYRANHAKSDFMAKISHDLKTPLNAILGYSEVISEELFGPAGQPKYAEYAKSIHVSGIYLLNLIDNIIEQSLSENGHTVHDAITIDIETLIDLSVAMVQPQFNAKNQSIVRERRKSNICVTVDQTAITQVITNLLSNAHKYSPKDSEISISVKTTDTVLELRVADSGIGMTSEEIELALLPLGRVSLPAGLHQEGLGLGLPIVCQILKRHDGDLSIESVPGHGTVVVVRLNITNNDTSNLL